jgi:hypothetical protein
MKWEAKFREEEEVMSWHIEAIGSSRGNLLWSKKQSAQKLKLFKFGVGSYENV